MEQITLRQAVDGGARELSLFCEAPACGHRGSIRIAEIARPMTTRLDALKPRCTKCKSRSVDVRPAYMGKPGVR